MAKKEKPLEPVVPILDQEERKKALDTALKNIEKTYGKGAVMRLGDSAQKNVDVISTSSLSIDMALGIGGIPNALGGLIADSDLRDLGMHTELMSDGYLKLYEAGIVTDRKKKTDNGKGVFGICYGTPALYDFVDNNRRNIYSASMSYTNNPKVIASFDDFLSINGCVSCDLYGQVSAETAGTRQISGAGGQLDFVTGTYMAEHGKSIITMTSSRVDSKGVRHSNIRPYFSGGDVVTTPRSQTQYIVTEYGAACMIGKSTWERAEELIRIAHPDLRDDLIRAAENQGIWRRSNKK